MVHQVTITHNKHASAHVLLPGHEPKGGWKLPGVCLLKLTFFGNSQLHKISVKSKETWSWVSAKNRGRASHGSLHCLPFSKALQSMYFKRV